MKRTQYYLFAALLVLSSCAYKGIIAEAPEPAGFFYGLINGLIWPLDLIAMGLSYIFPSQLAGVALYCDWNNGFGYWFGYVLGLLPYLGVIGGAIFGISGKEK